MLRIGAKKLPVTKAGRHTHQVCRPFQCLPLPPRISVISVKIPSLFLPLTQQLEAGDNDTDQDIDEHRFPIGRPGIGVVPAHVPLSVMFEVSGTSRLI